MEYSEFNLREEEVSKVTKKGVSFGEPADNRLREVKYNWIRNNYKLKDDELGGLTGNSGVVGMKRGNDLVEELLSFVGNRIKWRTIWSIAEMSKVENLIEGVETEKTIKEIISNDELMNEVSLMEEEEMDSWFKKLKNNGYEGRLSVIETPVNNKITEFLNFRIGPQVKKEKDYFNSTLKAIKLVKEYGEDYGLDYPHESMMIFEVVDLGINTRKGRGLINRNSGSIGRAFAKGYREDSLYIGSEGHIIEKNGKKRIVMDVKMWNNYLRHEIAHMMDPVFNQTSLVATEGFATVLAERIDFDELLRETNDNSYNKLTTSKERLISLYSETAEGVMEHETYDTSALFFAFIIDLYGKKKFVDFYRSLAAENGNVLEGMKKIGVSNPDELIEECVSRINRYKKPII